MGQFSWMSSDTNEQILNDQHKGYQTVKMVYKCNGKILIAEEDDYEGYGEFDGVDFYIAVCMMNNLPVDRDSGIGFYYSDNKGFYPQLYLEDVPNLDTIDFSIKPEDDDNQGWLQQD